MKVFKDMIIIKTTICLLLAYFIYPIDCRNQCHILDLCSDDAQSDELPYCLIGNEMPSFYEEDVTEYEVTTSQDYCSGDKKDCQKEYNLLSLDDYSDKERECAKVINQCWRPLLNIPFISGATNDYSTMLSDIDHVCRYFNHSADCIQFSLNSCHGTDFMKKVEAVLTIGDYFCSEKGLSVVKDYRTKSKCFLQPNKIFDLELAAQYCAPSSTSTPGNARASSPAPKTPCQEANKIYRCLTGLAANECGTAGGEIISVFFQGLATISSTHECTSRGAASLIKRSLSLLKMATERR